MRINFRRPRASTARRRPWLALLVVVVLVLGIVTVGCLPLRRGTYPIDIFSEMHYSQSYRSQEPPRLYPAEGAMPFVQMGPAPLVVEKVMAPASTADSVVLGRQLYAVNCLVCHGGAGKGDGPTRDFLVRWGGIPAPDITADGTSGKSEDDIFGLIAEGGTTAFAFAQQGIEPPPAAVANVSMPVFKKLLSEQEIWVLVDHVLFTLQGK